MTSTFIDLAWALIALMIGAFLLGEASAARRFWMAVIGGATAIIGLLGVIVAHLDALGWGQS